MTISRLVWNKRLVLLAICVFCTILNAPGWLTLPFLAFLFINVAVFNPWTLNKLQTQEDAEQAKETH